ncbi:MAG: DUF1958 domain-containing protein [Streptococcus sp.]|nr:DUF1958 domain-containing protein [Streptococcus sp.]
MKKKIVAVLLAACLALAPSLSSADELMDITRAAGYTEATEAYRPKSTLLIDGNTGDVLWEENADEVRDPASMSKAMTLYLVFEAMSKGEISEDTVITATPTDQAIADIYEISNNKIVAGVDYTVSELITMTAVPSSNVTTVMLANYLTNNDPDKWLDMMNEKSKELGMTNTKWFNASGAVAVAFKGYYSPQRYDNNQTNQTTARDLAIMTYNFIKKYPEILKYTSKPVVTVKKGTPYEETFENYNYSLPGADYGLKGVDGLKTGSSPRGDYNYISTCKRGNQRVISVILGVGNWEDESSEKIRHAFGNSLIEKMFKDYSYKKVLSKGKQKIDGKKYDVQKDVYATVKKGQEPKISVKNDYVLVDNGLKTVSPKIKASTVKSTKTGFFLFSGGQKEKQTSNKQNFMKHFALFCFLLLPLYVLYLIFINEKKRRQKVKERRQARQINN